MQFLRNNDFFEWLNVKTDLFVNKPAWIVSIYFIRSFNYVQIVLLNKIRYNQKDLAEKQQV